jgi:hypothetical protein
MKTFAFSLIFLIISISAFSKEIPLPIRKNSAFGLGEKLTFKLYYSSWMTGNVTAGEMTSEINKKRYIVRGDTTYNVKVIGKTKGPFNSFFKVNDVYQTYIDVNSLVPRYFVKRIKEGDFEDSRDVHFFHEQRKALYVNNKNQDSGYVKIHSNVQDLISAIYFARTFNADTLKINDAIKIDFFMDDSVYQTKLVFVGRATTTTAIGKVKCLKFKPSVQTGAVFKDDDKLVVYISDDKNHLPILAESEVMVGKIKIELINYSGLRNNFTALIK